MNQSQELTRHTLTSSQAYYIMLLGTHFAKRPHQHVISQENTQNATSLRFHVSAKKNTRIFFLLQFIHAYLGSFAKVFIPVQFIILQLGVVLLDTREDNFGTNYLLVLSVPSTCRIIISKFEIMHSCTPSILSQFVARFKLK